MPPAGTGFRDPLAEAQMESWTWSASLPLGEAAQYPSVVSSGAGTGRVGSPSVSAASEPRRGLGARRPELAAVGPKLFGPQLRARSGIMNESVTTPSESKTVAAICATRWDRSDAIQIGRYRLGARLRMRASPMPSCPRGIEQSAQEPCTVVVPGMSVPQ
jgi:hypothetical protein